MKKVMDMNTILIQRRATQGGSSKQNNSDMVFALAASENEMV
jgi:hypothetical protein